ncbi:hypothetical protein OPT61_g7967 [Boeremia exigua]|uniref:Uncharacterized protein n=1 Tax=Boeremia exigua TaxID=749465 RepID=A0ACC2I0R4_9PLEO|nr:hypothetical protein OPT61_g7967 [Boeremia exigua]
MSSLAAVAEQEAVVEAAVLLQVMSSEAGGACRPQQRQTDSYCKPQKAQRPGARTSAAKEGNVECGDWRSRWHSKGKAELEVRQSERLCVYPVVLFSVARPSRNANENRFLAVTPAQTLEAPTVPSCYGGDHLTTSWLRQPFPGPGALDSDGRAFSSPSLCNLGARLRLDSIRQVTCTCWAVKHHEAELKQSCQPRAKSSRKT